MDRFALETESSMTDQSHQSARLDRFNCIMDYWKSKETFNPNSRFVHLLSKKEKVGRKTRNKTSIGLRRGEKTHRSPSPSSPQWSSPRLELDSTCNSCTGHPPIMPQEDDLYFHDIEDSDICTVLESASLTYQQYSLNNHHHPHSEHHTRGSGSRYHYEETFQEVISPPLQRHGRSRSGGGAAEDDSRHNQPHVETRRKRNFSVQQYRDSEDRSSSGERHRRKERSFDESLRRKKSLSRDEHMPVKVKSRSSSERRKDKKRDRPDNTAPRRHSSGRHQEKVTSPCPSYEEIARRSGLDLRGAAGDSSGSISPPPNINPPPPQKPSRHKRTRSSSQMEVEGSSLTRLQELHQQQIPTIVPPFPQPPGTIPSSRLGHRLNKQKQRNSSSSRANLTKNGAGDSGILLMSSTLNELLSGKFLANMSKRGVYRFLLLLLALSLLSYVILSGLSACSRRPPPPVEQGRLSRLFPPLGSGSRGLSGSGGDFDDPLSEKDFKSKMDDDDPIHGVTCDWDCIKMLFN